MLFGLLLAGGALYAGIKAAHAIAADMEKPSEQQEADNSGDLATINVKPIETATPIEEQKVNRDLAISIALTGLAGVGTLVFPLLSLVTVPGFIYLALPVYKRALDKLKVGEFTVDTMMMASSLVAFTTGYIFLMGLTYVLFYIAEKFILKVQNNTNQSFIDVFKQAPRFAWIPVDEVEVKTPIEDLLPGDIVVVHTGETIPVDGVIVEGTAAIDQHILTGESQLAEKAVGDYVYAATVVLSGQLRIEVDKAGQETTVARIGEILNNTVDFKSGTELRAETLANQTVLPFIALSGVVFPFLGIPGAMCVLQSHFGYRMRLVGPITTLSYFKLMSDNSILVKDGRTLDLLNTVDTIVFDKTGTLTEEQPQVGRIHCCADYSEDEVLQYAAIAEQKQNHPIAQAILHEAEQRQLELPTVDDASYKVGYGLSVRLNGNHVHVGSERFMHHLDITIPTVMDDSREACHAQGHSFIMVALDNTLLGLIELQPTLRAEAQTVIQQLRKRQNIKHFYIISGDQTAPTRQLAAELGIDNYFAETLPQEKSALIEQLQIEGKSVCFIGDGINDSIALKKAQVSISLKGASSVATDTAQIVFMDGKLAQLPALFEIAEDFNGNINTGFLTLLVPSAMSIGGAFFLHFGMLQAVVLTQVGLMAGIANGIRPRLQKPTYTAVTTLEKSPVTPIENTPNKPD